MELADQLEINSGGAISASGVMTNTHQSGGSGGGIWITCAQVGGTGAIYADGSSTGTSRAGGAGGRVAVYALSSTFAGVIRASGGLPGSSSTSPERPGTVYLELGEDVTATAMRVPAGARLHHL